MTEQLAQAAPLPVTQVGGLGRGTLLVTMHPHAHATPPDAGDQTPPVHPLDGGDEVRRRQAPVHGYQALAAVGRDRFQVQARHPCPGSRWGRSSHPHP